MTTLDQSVAEFLAQRRIAIVGVSRTRGKPANLIYRKLRGSGYEVFPVNPNAGKLEGDRCYPTLDAVPHQVDAVVIATRPETTDAVVRDCARLKIKHVWMHRSFGTGSVSSGAVDFCREHGISVIPGACPMMFCAPVDIGHRCMRWVLKVSGKLPVVAAASPERSSGERTKPGPAVPEGRRPARRH